MMMAFQGCHRLSPTTALFLQERKRRNLLLFTQSHLKQSEFTKQSSHRAQEIDISKPYAYYEVLGIPKSSRVIDIKQAYFRLAKKYHPDMVSMNESDEINKKEKEEEMRAKFEQITEAYTTLIDVTQRHFYDQHGFSSEALKRAKLPSIFDYTPKYTLYSDRIHADGDTTELEDWFRAQGHSMDDPKITLRQRLKNAYVEFKFGMNYYNFPWNWRGFFVEFCVWASCVAALMTATIFLVRNYFENLPADHPHRPKKINDAWEDYEQRDILYFLNIRKRFTSPLSIAGVYHNSYPAERKPSEYDTNLQSNTLRTSKSRNLERHLEREQGKVDRQKRILEFKRRELERQQRKIENQLKKLDELLTVD